MKAQFDIFDLEGRLYEDDLLTIHLIVNNICNQNCYYCLCNDHPEHIKVKQNFTFEQFDKVIKFIKKQEKERVEFYFFGGEPTLHPNLIEFINILNTELGNTLINVNIITNFTKEVDYFNKLDEKVNLTLSLHTDECKDWDEWFKRAIKIKDKINILKIILSENNLDDVIYLCENYSHYFDSDQFEIQMIYQLEGDYIETAKKKLSKYFLTDGDDTVKLVCNKTNVVVNGTKLVNTESYKFKNYKNFQGMMCSAGFWILENGDVLKCSKDIVRKQTNILNIFNDDIKKLNKWGLCTHTICNCEEGCTKISIKKYLDIIKNG